MGPGKAAPENRLEQGIIWIIWLLLWVIYQQTCCWNRICPRIVFSVITLSLLMDIVKGLWPVMEQSWLSPLLWKTEWDTGWTATALVKDKEMKCCVDVRTQLHLKANKSLFWSQIQGMMTQKYSLRLAHYVPTWQIWSFCSYKAKKRWAMVLKIALEHQVIISVCVCGGEGESCYTYQMVSNHILDLWDGES